MFGEKKALNLLKINEGENVWIMGEKHKTLGSRIANLSTNSRGIKLNTFFMCQV